jgi:hypothetical protein
MANGFIKEEGIMKVSTRPITISKRAIEIEITHKKPIILLFYSVSPKPGQEIYSRWFCAGTVY